MASKKSVIPPESKNKARGSFPLAFEATAAARAKLLPEQLLGINLDIQTVLTTVLGALPRMNAMRETIDDNFKKFDFEAFDSIQSYAEALAHAHFDYLATSGASDVLPELVLRASTLRNLLVADATTLARRELIDGKPLARLKGGNGHLNVATDLGVLVVMLRDRWSDIQARCAIQASELDEAQHLYERITVAHAQRALPSSDTTAASDQRQRAYTLLVNTYDHARRAILYLRGIEKDGDKIAPSLYAGRRRRRASQVVEPEEEAPISDEPT